MCKINNRHKKHYVNYHMHGEDSNPITQADSAENPRAYLNRMVDLGHTVYCSTEHGISSNWVRKYLMCKEINKEYNLCDEHKIKFVYAVEAYVYYSEKLYHMMLIAKNMEGMKRINRMIYDSRDNLIRRRPGIRLHTLKKHFSEDIIATTACIGGIFKEPTGDLLLEIAKIFKRNLWIEIAPHQSDIQKDFNFRAVKFARKYDLTLVSANDSHFAHPSGKHDRDELLLSKGLVYENEGDFYMDYPDYDEVLRRYELQGVVPRVVAEEALNNTNIIKTFGDIELGEGGEFKVPTLYPELSRKERCLKFLDIINDRWDSYATKHVSEEDYPRYREEIKKELTEVFECKMEDFFLTSMAILEKGIQYGGVITKSNRGSSSSFFINNLCGFTSIDRLKSKVPILMERFMTAERIITAKTTPDIDNNVADPAPFIRAQSELLGERSSLPMIAFGTLKAKSAFKMLCRAKGDIPVELQNAMSKQIDKFENDYKYASDEERLELNLADYLDEDGMYELYEEGRNYFGMITDPKVHPCAYVVSNDDLIDLIGVNFSASGDMCVNLEGKYAETLGYLKLDWLTVSVVDLIDKVYKEIGIPQPDASELYKLVEGDKKTWDIYRYGATMCVNQVEKPKTTAKCMEYAPFTLEDLCAFIAAVRPGFKTFYKRFSKRERFEFGIKVIDALIRGDYSTGSWILYQEHVMLILEWAGFEPKKTYETLKGIGKKKIKLIMAAKEQFLKQCKEHMMAEGVSEIESIEKAKNIWQVIEDSAEYSFNSSHSYGMAHDSLWIAYAKAHYPVQTYKVCIEFFTKRGEKNKVSKLKSEAQRFFGINIPSPRFGQDNREIWYDLDSKTITLDLSTIKGVGKDASEALYNIRDFEGTYTELYGRRAEFGINKRSLGNLIKTGYFSKYGNQNRMLFVNEKYKEYKTLNKSRIPSEYVAYESYLNLTLDEFERLCYDSSDKETKATLKFEDPITLFNEISKNTELVEPSTLQQLFWEVDLTGSHEEDLKQNSIIGLVMKSGYSVKKKMYNVCVLDVKTNREHWIGIRNHIPCEAKDLIYIPQIEVKVYDSGYVDKTAPSNMNLTQMFGKTKEDSDE